MPARPTRRRIDSSAGPALADEPTPLAAVPAPAVVERPARARTRAFTVLLDDETHARFGRLLDELRGTVGPIATRGDGNGRNRAGYVASRADLLRSLLAAAEDDPAVMARAAAMAQHHYTETP